MTLAAVVGGVYAALTCLLPGPSYGPVQLRVAEGLAVLPYLFPAATPGLTAGCLVANLLSPYGPFDLVVGTAATGLAALLTLTAAKSAVSVISVTSVITVISVIVSVVISVKVSVIAVFAIVTIETASVVAVVSVFSVISLLPVLTILSIFPASRSGLIILRFLTGFLCHISFFFLSVAVISILSACLSSAICFRLFLYRFRFCFHFWFFRLFWRRFLESLFYFCSFCFCNRTHMVLYIYIHCF